MFKILQYFKSKSMHKEEKVHTKSFEHKRSDPDKKLI